MSESLNTGAMILGMTVSFVGPRGERARGAWRRDWGYRGRQRDECGEAPVLGLPPRAKVIGAGDVNPYLFEPTAEPTLRRLLHTHLDLEHLDGDRSRPKLLIGATDVLHGNRVIFTGEDLTYDGVIASAAVPTLFRAVKAGRYLCWDGLFTTNPPVREFTDLNPPPDEIWLVQPPSSTCSSSTWVSTSPFSRRRGPRRRRRWSGWTLP